MTSHHRNQQSNSAYLHALNTRFESLSLSDSLKEVVTTFSEKTIFSSSLGPEDQVITDVIFSNDLPIDVFTLDTGRLFPETYELIDKTTTKYQKDIKIYYPKHEPLQGYVEKNGINAPYKSIQLRKQCCQIRKIEPLNRALKGAEVWITGLRANQSDHRSAMSLFEWDLERNLLKFNPLIHWSTEKLWYYINAFEVPYNKLHKQGFPSIGCQPCTRPIGLHENERAGRWWWENEDKKECGLHTNRQQA